MDVDDIASLTIIGFTFSLIMLSFLYKRDIPEAEMLKYVLTAAISYLFGKNIPAH